MAKEIYTKIISVEQPIGTFYIGCVNALKLKGAVDIKRKSENKDGEQRDLISGRAAEIARYCEDPDATFPTAIIISVDTKRLNSFEIQDDHLLLSFSNTFGDVIDGQHRLIGIWESSKAEDFNLPVVFMIDPTVEERAYVFSIINSKQKNVNPSLIYELFDVSTTRSPKKTAHELARSLNSREDSPFYNRLKMLGKRTEGQDNATLSQGSFSKRVIKLISKYADDDQIKIKKGIPLEPDNQLIFRKYFIDDRDDVILKILMNCFTSLKKVFLEYWENPTDNILWKSTGFNAIIDSLPEMFRKGLEKKTLKPELFIEIFENLKRIIKEKNIDFTGQYFGSNEQHIKILRTYIERAVDKVR